MTLYPKSRMPPDICKSCKSEHRLNPIKNSERRLITQILPYNQAYRILGRQTGGGTPCFHLPFSQPPIASDPFAPRMAGFGTAAMFQLGAPAHPGGGGRFWCMRIRFLFLYLDQQQARMVRMRRPPITEASAITNVLLFCIQLGISLPTLAPSHCPFEHFPPPWQDVPSRKFCCIE